MNFGSGSADFSFVRLYGLSGNVFHGNEQVTLEYQINWNHDLIKKHDEQQEYDDNIIVGFHLIDQKGNTFFGINSYLSDVLIDPSNSDGFYYGNISFKFPKLRSGDYFLTSAVAYGSHENHFQLCWYEDGISLKGISDKKYQIGFIDVEYKFNNECNT